jgi:pentatricopeptide repeat protein
MIAACCFLGHLEQAGMHRARIIEAGMIPSPDSYATMIASSRDSTDEALVARDLFEESQAMGVVPNLYLFNTIISKLSKARKAEMALELFGRMKAQGIRPSSVTYGAVINACCRVGDAESAANLFEEMSAQRNFRPRVPPFK